MGGTVIYKLGLHSDDLVEVVNAIEDLRCSIENGNTVDRDYEGVEFTINVDMEEEDEKSVCSEFAYLKKSGSVVFYEHT